jgi:hypothetical protein
VVVRGSATAVVRLHTYWIACACGAIESVAVTHAFEVYAKINRLGWGLVPTQHSEHMSGVCPACRLTIDVEVAERGQ